MLKKFKKIYFLPILVSFFFKFFILENVLASAIDIERSSGFNVFGKVFFSVLIIFSLLLPFLILIVIYLIYDLFFKKNHINKKIKFLKEVLLSLLIIFLVSFILLCTFSHFISSFVFDFYRFIL